MHVLRRAGPICCMSNKPQGNETKADPDQQQQRRGDSRRNTHTGRHDVPQVGGKTKRAMEMTVSNWATVLRTAEASTKRARRALCTLLARLATCQCSVSSPP